MRETTLTDKWILAVAIALYLAIPIAGHWPQIVFWLSKDSASGWVQGVGSILAILGAFRVASLQLEAQREQDVRRRELEALEKEEGRREEIRGLLVMVDEMAKYVEMLIRDIDMAARGDDEVRAAFLRALARHVRPHGFEVYFGYFYAEFQKIPLHIWGAQVQSIAYLRIHLNAIPELVEQIRTSLDGDVSALNFQPMLLLRMSQIDQNRLRTYEEAGISTHAIAPRWVKSWTNSHYLGDPITIGSPYYPHSFYFTAADGTHAGNGITGRTGPTLQEIRSSYGSGAVGP